MINTINIGLEYLTGVKFVQILFNYSKVLIVILNVFLLIFICIFAINLILQEGIDLNILLFTNRVKKNVLKAVCLTRNTLPDIIFNSVLICDFKHRIFKINLNKFLQGFIIRRFHSFAVFLCFMVYDLRFLSFNTNKVINIISYFRLLYFYLNYA